MARSWYGGYDGGFPAYVSVADRRARATREAKQLTKKGRKLEPVSLDGDKIAVSFWGKAWCKNLESYSDYANRLPRGRSYLRNGLVIDLRIAEGRIDALVRGSNLYEVTVEIDKLSPRHASALASRCKGRIDSVVSLLRGELPKELLTAMIDPVGGLFPAPKQMRIRCSCPDSAALCKHLAAVLYGIGARFDKQPETFFTLRSVKLEALVATRAAAVAAPAPAQRKARAGAAKPKGRAALEQIFGIELDPAPPPRARRSR